MRRLNLLFAASFLFASTNIYAQRVSKAEQATIKNAKQGQVIKIPGVLSRKIQSIDLNKMVLPGPQFIISDDPEYIREQEAIALQENIEPGAIRLYVYNVNGVEKPAKINRKITAVLKNTGTSNMHLRMLKYSSQKPSGNYFQIGKRGLTDYFNSNGSNEIRVIKPGEAISVDDALENAIVKYNDLVHGFYEFTIDQPGQISILQTSPSTSGPDALKKGLKIIPTSGVNAGRGLFGVSNYKITNTNVIDTKDGISQIIIADGDTDPWVQGIEGQSGNVAHLAGNYGVMYNIDLKWKSSDGKGLALVTWNSRSGDNQWCSGMAASMIVSKGKFKEGVIELPKDQLVTKGAPEAILVQVFKPENKNGENTLSIVYSPPGASCLPTPLIFVPVDLE